MKTSNFSRAGREPGAVSIARGTPPWFRGRRYEPLMPSWALVSWAKQELTAAVALLARTPRLGGATGDSICGAAQQTAVARRYTERYHAEVLDRLDPQRVAADLAALCPPLHEPILLCWESPGEFCHRRLVAEWLERALGIVVPELDARCLQLPLEVPCG